MPPAAILSFLYAEPDPINKLMWPADISKVKLMT